MRARWASVDKNIGTKMCWKLVDDNSGEEIFRSIICSAIQPGTANLQVDPLKPLPTPVVDIVATTGTSAILDDFMSLANFETPFTASGPVDSIPDSTK